MFAIFIISMIVLVADLSSKNGENLARPYRRDGSMEVQALKKKTDLMIKRQVAMQMLLLHKINGPTLNVDYKVKE